jgi:hypothetical protein
LALRKHSRQSGMITRRAQNTILSSLNDQDLAAVVLELQRSGTQQ